VALGSVVSLSGTEAVQRDGARVVINKSQFAGMVILCITAAGVLKRKEKNELWVRAVRLAGLNYFFFFIWGFFLFVCLYLIPVFWNFCSLHQPFKSHVCR